MNKGKSDDEKKEEDSMVNKKLTKKIVTMITTLAFVSYGIPLFPLKNINSLLDTNEIIANADSGGGYGSGSTTSGDGPQFSRSNHYGLRFYSVNYDGDIIGRYYFQYNYAGKTRYAGDSGIVYESESKAAPYATEWAKYDMTNLEKNKKAELKTSFENFFNDTANQKTVEGNIMYDLNDVLKVVDDEPDTVNGKTFVFNKSGIKEKIKSLQTKEVEGVTYIARISSIDSVYVTGNIDGITVSLRSERSQGEPMICDIVDDKFSPSASGYLTGHQNLLRIKNQYIDSIPMDSASDLDGNIRELSDYLPKASTANGKELQGWLYGDVAVTFNNVTETCMRTSYIYEYALGLDNFILWNQVRYRYDATPKGDTDEFSSFRLIVEPLVDIPIRSSNDDSYAGRFYGGWYGYMTTLQETYPGSNGGSYTQASIKSRVGQGYKLQYIANTKNPSYDPEASDERGDGDIYFNNGLVYLAPGYDKLPSNKGYSALENYDSRDIVGNVGWGLHVYFPNGQGSQPEPHDPINTYAVDKDENPSIPDVQTPSKPDRPELSRIEYDNSSIDTNITLEDIDRDKYSSITKNTTGDFQIIKLYANVYKTADRIEYDSDTYSKASGTVKIQQLENGTVYESDKKGTYTYYDLTDASGNVQWVDSYVLTYQDGSIVFDENGNPVVVSGGINNLELVNSYYTKVEQVTAENADISADNYDQGQFYMVKTSRDVFITEEYSQTAIAPDINGFKLAAWHTSEKQERDDNGNLIDSKPYTVADWLSLDTTKGNEQGGYKLDFHFNQTMFPEGTASESQFHFSPTESSHFYDRLYEDQSIDGHASPGLYSNADGSLTIDDQEQKTIYLLYLRELESITTDTAVDTPREGVPSRTWTPGGSGRPTGDNTGTRGPKRSETPTGSGTPAFPEHKFHVVKIYGTTNPYTFETADDYVSYQDLATYNVRISDEYGVDGSQYHLRAYTVSNTYPLGMDYLKSHVGEVLPADTLTGTGVYTASQWADGWQRSGFDYKDTTSDKNANQFAHHGFIDGYDGWSGNDGKTNPEYSSYDTVGDGVKALIPTNKNILDAQTEGHKDITSFQTLMQKHFNSSSSGADTDDRYMIEWTGGSYTKGIQGLYVYPNEGYDKTIYFGDYVDKSSEGTLYLLYLKEDNVVYRSEPLIIPESYITRAFDLNENSITLSGDATALYKTLSKDHTSGSYDDTGEATHSLMEHRFIFSTKDMRSTLQSQASNLEYTITRIETETDEETGEVKKKTVPVSYPVTNLENTVLPKYGLKDGKGSTDVYLSHPVMSIDLIAANGTIINTPYNKYNKDGLTYADGSKVDINSASSIDSANVDFTEAKIYAAGTAGYFYNLSEIGRYYIDGNASMIDISKDYEKKNNIKLQKVLGFKMSTRDDYSINTSDFKWKEEVLNKVRMPKAQVFYVNGLSYVAVFGRVNDAVTIADYKYRLHAEEPMSFGVNIENGSTTETYFYTIIPFRSTVLSDNSGSHIDKYTMAYISEYQTDNNNINGNRLYTLSSILYAGADGNVNSKSDKLNQLSKIMGYLDSSPYTDGVDVSSIKALLNSFMAGASGVAMREYQGASILMDGIKMLVFGANGFVDTPDYSVIRHSDSSSDNVPAITFGYKNPYLRQSYGWVKSELNDVLIAGEGLVGSSGLDSGLDMFGLSSYGIDLSNISSVIAEDNATYHGHNLLFTNRALYNTAIGLVKNRWVNELSIDDTDSIKSTVKKFVGSDCTDLMRIIMKYVEPNTDTGTEAILSDIAHFYEPDTSIIYQSQSDINITIPVYNYSYSGIKDSPYSVANTGLRAASGDIARFKLGFAFDPTARRSNSKISEHFYSSPNISTTRHYSYLNGSEVNTEVLENPDKINDLERQASVTTSPIIIKNNNIASGTDIGVRQSAVRTGQSIKVYPYYLMQAENTSNRNYVKTEVENGKLVNKSVVGSELLLVAGSYSRTFVPDEYFGINIHDANNDGKYGTPTVGIVNNISSDGKMSGGSGYIRITSDQWSTHATSNQVLGVQNCALPGGALFGVDIDKDSRRELEVISYQPILTGSGRYQVDSTAPGFEGLPDVTAGLPSDITDTVGGSRNSIVANHLQFANSVRSYLGSVNIDTYVDQSSEGVLNDRPAEEYGNYALYEDATKVNQDDLKAQQVEDKYYLRQDNDAEGTDSEKEVKDQLKNEADIDVSPLELNPDGTFGGDGTKTDIKYYTFYTTVDGRIMCHVSSNLFNSSITADYTTARSTFILEEDSENGSVVTVLGRGQTIEDLEKDSTKAFYKQFNDRTQIIQKLVEAFERNHGYDKENYFPKPNASSRDEFDNKFTGWYNEAFDGITYAVIKTTMQVGFNNPYERGAVLDPTLTPSSATKSDMFTRYNVSQFATADYSLKALDTKIDGYEVDGGKVKVTYASVDPLTGQTSDNGTDELSLLGVVTDINGNSTPVGINPDSLKKLFVSDIFFIPNVTVQDLK